MSKTKMFRLSGRASVLALTGAVVFFAGVALLAPQANAKGQGVRVGRLSGPIELLPAVQDGSGDSALIGLLLPAVQRGSTDFQVRVVTGDGSVALMNLPGMTDRQIIYLEAFEVQSRTDRANTLHIRNRKTGDESVIPAIDPCFFVELLPAVQRNGRPVDVGPMNIVVSGQRKVVLGDGSVMPQAFKYALSDATSVRPD